MLIFLGLVSSLHGLKIGMLANFYLLIRLLSYLEVMDSKNAVWLACK